jgi:hypothetical protein
LLKVLAKGVKEEGSRLYKLVVYMFLAKKWICLNFLKSIFVAQTIQTPKFSKCVPSKQQKYFNWNAKIVIGFFKVWMLSTWDTTSRILKRNENWTSWVLELIHMDLCGPPKPSFNVST